MFLKMRYLGRNKCLLKGEETIADSIKERLSLRHHRHQGALPDSTTVANKEVNVRIKNNHVVSEGKPQMMSVAIDTPGTLF